MSEQEEMEMAGRIATELAKQQKTWVSHIRDLMAIVIVILGGVTAFVVLREKVEHHESAEGHLGSSVKLGELADRVRTVELESAHLMKLFDAHSQDDDTHQTSAQKRAVVRQEVSYLEEKLDQITKEFSDMNATLRVVSSQVADIKSEVGEVKKKVNDPSNN